MVDSSRFTALKILNDVLNGERFLNLSVKERVINLSDQDRKFCVSLVNNTLENLILIDYITGLFVIKGIKDKTIRNVMRLGVAQLFFMSSVFIVLICLLFYRFQREITRCFETLHIYCIYLRIMLNHP